MKIKNVWEFLNNMSGLNSRIKNIKEEGRASGDSVKDVIENTMEQEPTKEKNRVIKTHNKYDKVSVTYEKPDGSRGYTEITVDWFFAATKKDEEKTRSLLASTKYEYEIRYDEKFPDYIKIHCKDIYKGSVIQSRSEIVLFLEAEGVETYEGDLLNDRRWYIDNSIEIGKNFRRLYFDIETDDSHGGIVLGRDRILSFAAIDSTGKKFFARLEEMTDNAEKELLLKFLKLISNYDIILGWNTKGFDVPYLKARMRKTGLRYGEEYKAWYNVAHYDLLARMRHAYRFDSQLKKFDLGYIAKHFLGKGKVEHKGQRIIDLYRNDPKLLRKYNIEDTVLVKDIDEKLGVSDMMISQSSWCGVPPAHFGLYSIIDAYILKTAHSLGKFGRTSVRALEERDIDNTRGNEGAPEETDEAQYMGAIVLDPIPGRYDKVYTFDYKSLYPSLIITSNIGYDSIEYSPTPDCIVNPGTLNNLRKTGVVKPTYFKKEPSVINLAITQLLKKRTEYKDLKLKMIEEGTNSGPDWDRVYSDEVVVKELSNSTYGIMGLAYGRYFSVDIAESITLFGQWCIEFAKQHFNSMGYEVIYGDTDSVFVNTHGQTIEPKKELEIFHKRLKLELKEKYNIEDSKIQLNPDKEYDGFILVAKKSYVGTVTKQEGKTTSALYGRGLDFIKKNIFEFAREKQIELIKMLLKEELLLDEVKKWMQKTKEEYMSKDFDAEDLTLIHKVGKALDTYKGTPPVHIRVARELQKKVGAVHKGTEIEFVITNAQPGKPVDGVLLSDYAGVYDKEYYWDHKTLPTLYRIIQPIYGGVEWTELELTKSKTRVSRDKDQMSLF